MQHQIRIEDGLYRSDAAGAVERLFRDQVGMAAARHINDPVRRERGGHRVAAAIEVVVRRGDEPIERLDDDLAIGLGESSHLRRSPRYAAMPVAQHIAGDGRRPSPP